MCLSKVLQAFKYQYDNQSLHDAGNDANYTLRALLILAEGTQRKPEEIPSSQIKDRLEMLVKVARSPVPDVGKRIKQLREEHKRSQEMVQRYYNELDGDIFWIVFEPP